MPDWEYMLWDAERIKDIDSIWLKECLQERKWAFAADFIRVYALYHFGGVYLDTDVEVYRSFDPLLIHSAFIGREWTWHTEHFLNQQYLTSHCMGCRLGNEFIGRCLSYFSGRHFVKSSDPSLPPSLKYDQQLLPFVQCMLAIQDGYKPELYYDRGIKEFSDITIYSSSFFDPRTVKNTSFCKHYCLGSWLYKSKDVVQPSLSYRIRYKLDLWTKLLIELIWHVF